MTPLRAAPGGTASGDALERALDRACGGRAIPGNAVTHVCSGPAAFDLMLDVIDHARHTLHFENYIIRSDHTGRRFADALMAAAERGVAVRVLYDALGSRRTGRGYWRRLREAGAAVAAFHRLHPFRPLRSIRRDHRKYVAADARRAVVGGICIGDEWAAASVAGHEPWRDTAVEVRGPAVSALELIFRRLWMHAGGPTPETPVPSPAEPCGQAAIHVIDGLPGKLRLVRAIEVLAASAAERLWVTDAYLVPPISLYATLMSVARDGVDVRVLVPGRSDLPVIRTLTRAGYRELLEAGVRIWEWHGPMLHAKTALVDDTWFKVGSSNLNPSSLFSNFEIDLLVRDGKVAAAAAQQFRHDLAHAVEVVLRPRRAPRRLAARLPPAVVPETRPGTATTAARLGERAVVTVRQVAGGARRSIAGTILFALLGSGVLLLALPRVMAYLLAGAAFLLAAGGIGHVVTRRRHRPE